MSAARNCAAHERRARAEHDARDARQAAGAAAEAREGGESRGHGGGRRRQFRPEVEAKREARRARDAADAATLRKWAVRDGQGSPCELIDIGANLIKTKGDGAVEEQLRRCELTGVGGVIVTGTSVVDSRRALKLVRSTAAHAVKLYCTAGVHPHDAKSCDEETISVLREMLQAPECVAVGECGLDYDRMFSRREVQLEWFERQAVLAVEQGMPLFLHERDVDADKGAPLGSAADLMGILDRAGVPPKRVCVHCFTGGEEALGGGRVSSCSSLKVRHFSTGSWFLQHIARPCGRCRPPLPEYTGASSFHS